MPAVDRRKPVPPYYQLCSQIRLRIESGDLAPGARLPAIADLAATHHVSRATVVRAISELARQGLIESRWGSGNYVTAPPALTAEIIIPGEVPSPTSRRYPFFNHFVDALRRSFAQPARRILLSYIDTHIPTAGEVLAVARARNADSLVFYRPTEEMFPVVRAAAREIPSVALFYPVPEADADALISDPAPALAVALRRRIALGQRRFLFSALEQYGREPAHSPYRIMLQTFERTLGEAGLPAETVTLSRSGSMETLDAAQRDLAARTPRDATIVSHYVWPAPAEGERDVICYTESPLTRERFGGSQTLLYLDMARMAEAAAKMLLERRDRPGLPPRAMNVEAELLDRFPGERR